MNLIYTDCLSSLDECIENIFAKIFSFYNDLLFLSMSGRVIGSQSVNTICKLRYPWGNGAGIQTEQASSADNWYLGTTRDQNINLPTLLILEILLDLWFQVGGLGKTSHHEYEVDWRLLFLGCCLNQLEHLRFDLIEERLKEGNHNWGRQVNWWGSSLFQVQASILLFCVEFFD